MFVCKDGPEHKVQRVKTNYMRWGATGWYDQVGEKFSPFELQERNKMRNPVFER